MTSETLLRKRDREFDLLQDSTDVQEWKRFHGEETEPFLHLLQLDQTSVEDDQEEKFAPSEELVNGVVRSLEEETAPTCCTSYPSSNSRDNFSAPDIFSVHEGQIRDLDSGVDLSYLLEASDDDLGIPPSRVRDLTEEFCQSQKETAEVLLENPILKSLGENWPFEDNFENYQQFEFCDNVWDVTQLEDLLNRDFDRQGMVCDVEFVSAACILETAGGM